MVVQKIVSCPRIEPGPSSIVHMLCYSTKGHPRHGWINQHESFNQHSHQIVKHISILHWRLPKWRLVRSNEEEIRACSKVLWADQSRQTTTTQTELTVRQYKESDREKETTLRWEDGIYSWYSTGKIASWPRIKPRQTDRWMGNRQTERQTDRPTDSSIFFHIWTYLWPLPPQNSVHHANI